VERVTEFVKERLRLGQAQQRRPTGRWRRKIEIVGDDWRNSCASAVVPGLLAQCVHPGSAAFAFARKEIYPAEKKIEGSLLRG
jgi:hypothetical protein